MSGTVAVPIRRYRLADADRRALMSAVNDCRIAASAIEQLAEPADNLLQSEDKLLSIQWIARKLVEDLTEIDERV
jgi:hypothetical protein